MRRRRPVLASVDPRALWLERWAERRITAEVLQPWHTALMDWLSGWGDVMPTPWEVQTALLTVLQPDREALGRILSDLHLRAATLGGQQGLDDIMRALGGQWPQHQPLVAEAARDQTGSRFAFQLRDPRLLKWLRDRGERITGEVTQTMLDDLRRVLHTKFYEEGLGPHEMAEDIENIFPVTYADRGARIARTETLFARGGMQAEVMARNGVQRKQWSTLMDTKTRDDHHEMDGQVRDWNEPFETPSGDFLDYPGDPAADADQVINCRCALLPVIDEPLEMPLQPWTGAEPRGGA